MAAKNSVVITATKIIDGVKRAVTYSGSGKDVTLTREQIKMILPTGTSDEDVIVVLMDNTQIFGVQEFDDLNTAISATDSTNS